eukprot:TRINITY_DN21448_c0_g1_i1.p1 TRINITY_DN21448_c0_g1~~TRINITY_DN21448_c0_g1_i1.p1  ORF type:complete len:351 (-),score=74.20 TRINITY_DN21448_c0_g1_i1:201-1211(-)
MSEAADELAGADGSADEEGGASAALLLAQLRSAPLASIRGLLALLPAAAPEIRASVHLLGSLVCSPNPEISEAAEELLEAIKREPTVEQAAGWRRFEWRGVEVKYWELEAGDNDLLLGYASWPSASILARLLIDAQRLADCEGAGGLPSQEAASLDGSVQYYALPASWAVKGRRVLEVGAGVGLTGLACGAIGASHVRLTDGEERLVQSLRDCHGESPVIDCELLDWRVDQGQETSDFIIGSDVLLGVAEGHVCIPGVISRRLRRAAHARALLLNRVRKTETFVTAASKLIEYGLQLQILKVAPAPDHEMVEITVGQLSTIDPAAYVLFVATWPAE